MNNTEESLLYDIYDPSNSVDGDYWQLGIADGTGDKDTWQQVSSCINRGLPTKEEKLFGFTAQQLDFELWGCLLWQGNYWIYRHFLTGRDIYNRPGRYFFVLFKLKSYTMLGDAGISNIIQYLEGQVRIPIDIKPLKAMSNKSPIETSITDQLFNAIQPAIDVSVTGFPIAGKIAQMKDGHRAWVVKQGSIVREYLDLDIPQPRPDKQLAETDIQSQKPTERPPFIKKRINKDKECRKIKLSVHIFSTLSWIKNILFYCGVVIFVVWVYKWINPAEYRLEVIHGSGAGKYKAGTSIPVNADPSTKKFLGWACDTSYIDNGKSTNATITMPPKNIKIIAIYAIFYLEPVSHKAIRLKSFTNAAQDVKDITWSIDGESLSWIKRQFSSISLKPEGNDYILSGLDGNKHKISVTYKYIDGNSSFCDTISIETGSSSAEHD